MAYQRSDNGFLGKSLGRLIGMLLVLYVFNEILDAIFPTVNTSTWFRTTLDLVTPLFGVIGILGAFEIVWSSLRESQLV